MRIAEILRAGKARLLELGWCKGDELLVTKRRDGGPNCAATAMMPFLGDPSNLEACELFRKANDITTGIGTWNDAPERTLEEVLAAYDKAIAAAEAQGS